MEKKQRYKLVFQTNLLAINQKMNLFTFTQLKRDNKMMMKTRMKLLDMLIILKKKVMKNKIINL